MAGLAYGLSVADAGLTRQCVNRAAQTGLHFPRAESIDPRQTRQAGFQPASFFLPHTYCSNLDFDGGFEAEV